MLKLNVKVRREFLSGRGILYIKLNWIYEMQIITES